MKREREGSGGWRPAIHGGARKVKLIIEEFLSAVPFVMNGWMAQSVIG